MTSWRTAVTVSGMKMRAPSALPTATSITLIVAVVVNDEIVGAGSEMMGIVVFWAKHGKRRFSVLSTTTRKKLYMTVYEGRIKIPCRASA